MGYEACHSIMPRTSPSPCASPPPRASPPLAPPGSASRSWCRSRATGWAWAPGALLQPQHVPTSRVQTLRQARVGCVGDEGSVLAGDVRAISQNDAWDERGVAWVSVQSWAEAWSAQADPGLPEELLVTPSLPVYTPGVRQPRGALESRPSRGPGRAGRARFPRGRGAGQAPEPAALAP